MLPPQKFQLQVIQRLDSQRYSIDACASVGAKPLSLNAGGVGLQGDLHIGQGLPATVDRIQNLSHSARFHQGWRAASEKDRRHLMRRLQRRHMFDFFHKGGRIFALINTGMAHV